MTVSGPKGIAKGGSIDPFLVVDVFCVGAVMELDIVTTDFEEVMLLCIVELVSVGPDV